MKPATIRSRPAVSLLLVVPLLAACSLYNPFREPAPSSYVAPSEVGRGDCAVEVQNLSSRPLDVYYYHGLGNPPRLTAGWPRLGLLEPGQSSTIYGDCEERRLVVHAYATSPVDQAREYNSIRRERALVEGRREILRLRLRR